jgi:hypothetical protein
VLSIRRILLIVAVFAGAPGCLLAQFPMPTARSLQDAEPAQVHEIVSNFCRLDYEGVRLDPQLWSKYQPLVWWKTAPGYSQIDVVARYTVDTPPDASHGRYDVTVHYRLLGTYDLATGYVAEPEVTNQDFDFDVTSENSEWRIADAENTFPHLSRAAMLKWLNTQLSTTQDVAAKTRYQNALKQIEAQSASPFAR